MCWLFRSWKGNFREKKKTSPINTRSHRRMQQRGGAFRDKPITFLRSRGQKNKSASWQGCTRARVCLCAQHRGSDGSFLSLLSLSDPHHWHCSHHSFPSSVSLFKIAPSFAACPSHSLSFFHTSHGLKTMVFILPSSSSLKISLCYDTGQPSEFISRQRFACVESSHLSVSHPSQYPRWRPLWV